MDVGVGVAAPDPVAVEVREPVAAPDGVVDGVPLRVCVRLPVGVTVPLDVTDEFHDGVDV